MYQIYFGMYLGTIRKPKLTPFLFIIPHISWIPRQGVIDRRSHPTVNFEDQPLVTSVLARFCHFFFKYFLCSLTLVSIYFANQFCAFCWQRTAAGRRPPATGMSWHSHSDWHDVIAARLWHDVTMTWSRHDVISTHHGRKCPYSPRRGYARTGLSGTGRLDWVPQRRSSVLPSPCLESPKIATSKLIVMNS